MLQLGSAIYPYLTGLVCGLEYTCTYNLSDASEVTRKDIWASQQMRKITVAHASGMQGTFSPPPRVSDHGTCVTHVPWCMPESLYGTFLCSRWRGKRSRHYRRMRNPQFYISGKRPMDHTNLVGAGDKGTVKLSTIWMCALIFVGHTLYVYKVMRHICVIFLIPAHFWSSEWV